MNTATDTQTSARASSRQRRIAQQIARIGPDPQRVVAFYQAHVDRGPEDAL